MNFAWFKHAQKKSMHFAQITMMPQPYKYTVHDDTYIELPPYLKYIREERRGTFYVQGKLS